MYKEGLDLRRARRALNELVRRSTSAGVSVSADGELGRMTGRNDLFYKRKSTEKRTNLLPSAGTYFACRPSDVLSRCPPSVFLQRLA